MLRLLIPLLLIVTPLAAQPEMDVQRLGTSVVDGGADTVTNTGTSPFNLTYTVRNDGSANLNLTGAPEVAISGETKCSVIVLSPPATPVAPTGASTFILQVSPTSSASFSFVVSIDNDDSNENPYNFTFNGTTSSPPAPAGDDGKDKGDNCSTGTGLGLGWLLVLSSLGTALLLRPKSLPAKALAD